MTTLKRTGNGNAGNAKKAKSGAATEFEKELLSLNEEMSGML